MIFDIEPCRGAGGIRMGMTRHQVEVMLGSVPRRFRKTRASPTLTDDFSNVGVHVYYKENDTVEAMEFFPPADVRFKSVPLFARQFPAVLALIRVEDNDCQVDEIGLISRALSLAIYAPNVGSVPDADVEGVLVAGPNYFR